VRLDADPERWLRTGMSEEPGTFKVVISAVPVGLELTASGYEDWRYGDDGSGQAAAVVVPEPGTSMELVLRLRANSSGGETAWSEPSESEMKGAELRLRTLDSPNRRV